MKNTKNKVRLSGRARLTCYKKDGSLKWRTDWMNNIITNLGIAEVVKLMGHGLGGDRFRYLAVGSDATAEAAARETLHAEITDGGLARAEATVTAEDTGGVTGDTMKLVKVWTASATRTVEEIGIFTGDDPSASPGVMLARKITGTKTVDDLETLTGEYEITLS